MSSANVHTETLDLNWRLITLISDIDRFDASWQAIERKEGQSLKELKSIATVRSVGASTRIEGSKLSDMEVDVLLKNMEISKLEERDQQEVVGYFEVLDLIDESYEGDSKGEGHVGANEKYRMRLSLEEAKQLKFWDYYFNPNKPEKIIFGSGLHRYLTDVQSAQVLKKICEIKKGTQDEDLSKDFLTHFCEIKKLDIDNIPLPNGALHRITNEKEG